MLLPVYQSVSNHVFHFQLAFQLVVIITTTDKMLPVQSPKPCLVNLNKNSVSLCEITTCMITVCSVLIMRSLLYSRLAVQNKCAKICWLVESKHKRQPMLWCHKSTHLCESMWARRNGCIISRLSPTSLKIVLLLSDSPFPSQQNKRLGFIVGTTS